MSTCVGSHRLPVFHAGRVPVPLLDHNPNVPDTANLLGAEHLRSHLPALLLQIPPRYRLPNPAPFL